VVLALALRNQLAQIGQGPMSGPYRSSNVAFRYCPWRPQREHFSRTMSEGYSASEKDHPLFKMSQRPRRISLAKTLNREPCLISIKTFDDPASVIPPDAFAAVLNVVTARLNQRVIR
jgi:hypothetical protein